MLLPILAIFVGLLLLIWSADRFVEGAASTARHAGMPPLLIGMVVVGFGTSAPELVVSALSALQGNPGLALGNAYGSNITNIALILGVTALISPISVHSQILRKELPILTAVTILACLQLLDGNISVLDASVLLMVFAGLMGWSIYQGLHQRSDILANELDAELDVRLMPRHWALFWLVIGLILLIVSSRILVWGAVSIAQNLGVSDLIIGLTIVAVGTSLPELASSVIAARKNEHDLALGNVIGSNLFNTLAVVGLAGVLHPLAVPPEALYRDGFVMGLLTVSLFVLGYGYRERPSRINRLEGGILLTTYLAYIGWLINVALSGH